VEEDMFYGPPASDIMCQRAEVLIELASAHENASAAGVKKRLLKAMDIVLFTIDLPRGKLVEIAKTADQPTRFTSTD
jgi:hypothetical protein